LKDTTYAHLDDLCEEDHSKITLLFLKVWIAWHDGEFHRYKLDPWNFVIFSSKSSIPLQDSTLLVDVKKGFYGDYSEESPLIFVHKDMPPRRFSIGRLFGGHDRRREDRLIGSDASEYFRT
jgi:hypothetical protein